MYFRSEKRLLPIWLALALILMSGLMSGRRALAQTAPAAAAPAANVEAKVARLIEQLGSPEFTAREKAQAELAKVGLEAFDALNDATRHDDVEIALRARYLVRAMQVQWHTETDSADVIKVLQQYGDQPDPERRSRIDRLKNLERRQGLAALCRLARYEPSEELSKYAALQVLGQLPQLTDAKVRDEVGRVVATGAGNGKRTATAWLRTFAKTLADAAGSIPDWETHIKAEHDLFTQSPDRTSRDVVRDLYRFEVALMQSLGREPDAVAVMKKSLSLLEGTADQLGELMDWLMERKAWPVVQEVAARFPKPLEENPELLYRLAESQEQDGKPDAAKQTAAKALAFRPDDAAHHFRIGKLLQERGLFTSAEGEFRFLLAKREEDVRLQLEVRYMLSEMLHDIGRELPAAEVVKGEVDLLEKNPQARELAIRSKESTVSRMSYFFALDLMEKGQLAEARKRLDEGAAADPKDADVLIALFRFPNQSAEQQAAIRKLVTEATESFAKDLEKFKAAGENGAGDPFGNDKRAHAMACNQYAWLVSNTFGDFDKAVEASRKSVEIRQELRDEVGAYYDTLGRCYFAKGDFENAIKYQTQALKFDPHSGQMKRQLALFQKAQAEKDKGK